MAYNLGLDISTSCTGWCLKPLSDAGDDFKTELGYVSLKKIKCTYEKAEKVKEELLSLQEKYEIKGIYIEENLQAFRPGFSSAKTLNTLAKFNGVVSYIGHEIFGTLPEFINVNHARKVIGLKTKRKKKCGKSTKEQVLEWCQTQPDISEFEWPTRVITRGPRKGLEVMKDECYDMADAYVIASAGPDADTTT